MPEIEEAHPLKQGLKPFPVEISLMFLAIEEAHPLKQGLKQTRGWPQAALNGLLKKHIH